MDHRSFRPAAGVTLLLLSLPALAVVPSGRSVLRQFAESQALNRVSAGDLIGHLSYPGKAQTAPAQLHITFADGCRGRFTLPEGEASVALARGSVTSQGTPPPALEALIAFMCPLFAIENEPASDAEERVSRLASSWGVDLAITSLNLLDGRAAYVVGAKPNEPHRAQIWFDKATDRPVRVIASRGGQVWDIRFEDPASIATNRIAPRVTHVWQNNALALTLHLMASQPKVSGPAAPATEEPEDSGE